MRWVDLVAYTWGREESNPPTLLGFFCEKREENVFIKHMGI